MATLLLDGRVLVTGGQTCTPIAQGTKTANIETAVGGCSAGIGDSSDVWDPTTNAFSRTGSMTRQRLAHTATLLSDGRVLITGNSVRLGDADTAEVYELR